MKKTTTNKTALTSSNLQSVLWDTLKAVKSKRLKYTEANAIASQAREICRVSKLNLEYMKMTGKKTTNVSGLITLE